MSAMFSPVMSVMLKAVRRSSRGLVRDFNEIRCLRSSYISASEFTRAAYLRSGRIIAEELKYYKQGYSVFFDGARDAKGEEGSFWFVSSMDSRTNFMNGLPYFATSIALVKDKEVVAAVIDAPILRETFYADKVSGVFAETGESKYVKMHVSRKESLSAALVDCTACFSSGVRVLADALTSKHAVLRSMGSVVLGFAYLCASCYDVLVYSGVHEYKVGIAKLFVEGSKGGVLVKDGVLVAGNFSLINLIEKRFLQ